jgi:protein-arginine kinase activator protein McsA
MKLEVFEKAAEIRKQINDLIDMESLIQNAAGDHHRLAAIIPMSTYDSELRIINDEVLSLELRDAFLTIIRDKIAKLREEFASL